MKRTSEIVRFRYYCVVMKSYQNHEKVTKRLYRVLAKNYVEFIKKSNQVIFMSGFTKNLGRIFIKSHENSLFQHCMNDFNQKVSKKVVAKSVTKNYMKTMLRNYRKLLFVVLLTCGCGIIFYHAAFLFFTFYGTICLRRSAWLSSSLSCWFFTVNWVSINCCF